MSIAVTMYFVGPVSSSGASHDNVTDVEVILSIVIFPSEYGAKSTINQTMHQAYKRIKITGSKKKIS